MLWLTTCASIMLVLAASAFIGWRRERRGEALAEASAQRSAPPAPQPKPPTRRLGFSGTLDRLTVEAKRKAG